MLAASAEEVFGVLTRKFVDRFNAVRGETRRNDGDAPDSFTCQALNCGISVWRQPFGESEPGLIGNQELLAGQPECLS